MALRRSPALTPRSLAARRSNALKSTGPRTPCGKARVSLNALKHGRAMGPAGRAPRFRERLLRAGYVQQEVLYDGLRSCLAQAFGAQNPRSRLRIDQMAASAWCQAVERRFSRTKLESSLESSANTSRFLSQAPSEPLRYRAEDHWRRIGLVFWVQHRRYLTQARLERVLRGLEPLVWPGPAEGLEGRVRCRVFRLRRPGYLERLRYALDRAGGPDRGGELRRRAARTGRLPHRRRVEVRLSAGVAAEAAAVLANAETGAATGNTAAARSVSAAAGRRPRGWPRRILAAARGVVGGLLKAAGVRKNALD